MKTDHPLLVDADRDAAKRWAHHGPKRRLFFNGTLSGSTMGRIYDALRAKGFSRAASLAAVKALAAKYNGALRREIPSGAAI